MIQKRFRLNWQLYILSFFVIGTTSCTIGRDITESDLAIYPNGSDVEVTFMDTAELNGELLAVDSSSVVVLVKKFGDGFTVSSQKIELPAIAEINFAVAENIWASHDNERIVGNGELTGGDHKAFTYLSRFPQGISPDLMNDLLEAYNQDELIKLGHE